MWSGLLEDDVQVVQNTLVSLESGAFNLGIGPTTLCFGNECFFLWEWALFTLGEGLLCLRGGGSGAPLWKSAPSSSENRSTLNL